MPQTYEDKTYYSAQKKFDDRLDTSVNTQPKGKPLTDQISEGLSSAAEATKNTLAGAAEAVQEAAIGAKEAVFGKAEDAQASTRIAEDKLHAKAAEGKEKFHEEKGVRSKTEKHADKIEGFADKAAKNIQKFGEKAADKFEEIGRGDRMREKERIKDLDKEVIRHNEDRFTRAEREHQEQNKGIMEKAGEKIEEFGQRIQGSVH